MRFLKNWWFISSALAVLLIGIVSFGLPLLVSLLDPWWVRLLTGGSVALAWGVLAFLRVRKAAKAARALEDSLAGADLAHEEGRALEARVKQSLAELKQSSGKRSNYLYDRPWYMIIGPPGAGKTTALLNSGLHFPDSVRDRRGIGGTRNLEFLFADEAVIVDTAGRYTTQDTDHKVDAAGWKTFLGLLRKNRPLQPINGVVVAIGVDELICNDCAELDEHSRTIRRRLIELREELQCDVPVYVMLTKADKLAGFVEYFADLDIEGRRAVLGHTLEHEAHPLTLPDVTEAFDRMGQDIADRQARRLYDETDPMRRSLIIGFPAQLQSLRSRLMRLLDGVFMSGKERPGILRGFYLTSGLQEGTPLDRILSSMADVFDREQRPVNPTGSAGQAFFLNRLLDEVMFKEAGLVTMSPKARNRQRLTLAVSLCGIGLVSLAVLGFWTYGFMRSQAFQSEITTEIPGLADAPATLGIDMVQYRTSDADLRAALPYLNALRNLPYGHAARLNGDNPWLGQLMLFDEGLSVNAEATYQRALSRIMLPRLFAQLEGYLQSDADPMEHYEPLKAYLMLGQVGDAPFDADVIRSVIVRDWAARVYPGSDAEPQRAQLEQHLVSLLAYNARDQEWKDGRPDVDSDVVTSARAAVGNLSLAQRAYAIMKQDAMVRGNYWSASEAILEGEALAFADPQAVFNYRVPSFFTRSGYNSLITNVPTAIRRANADLWVFGRNGQGALRQDRVNLRQDILKLYADDYIAAWQGLIDVMAPANYFGQDPRARQALGALTKQTSPLIKLLRALRDDTRFQGGAAGVSRGVVDRAVRRSRAGRIIADANGGGGFDAGATITRAFIDIHEYIGSGQDQNRAPIDDFLDAMAQAATAVGTAEIIGGAAGFETSQVGAATASAALQSAADRAPSQLRRFVTEAAGSNRDTTISAATGAISEIYARDVLPRCQEVAQEHYPFSRRASAPDAPPETMRELFGYDGLLVLFVNQRLLPLIDSNGPVWRWRSENPVASQFSPHNPEEFARALEIRRFVAEPLQFRISLIEMGDEVSEVVFFSGSNAPLTFTGTAGAPRAANWSLLGAVQEAYVELRGTSPETRRPGVLRRFEGKEGSWAFFHLVEQARKENAGESSITLQFGQYPRSAQFRIDLPSQTDPFSPSGLWSFRCPTSL